MLNQYGLGFVFTARDFASSKLQAIENSFTSLSSSVAGGQSSIKAGFKDVGLGLGLLTAGVGGAAVALSLANRASKFEQSLAAVGVVSGATAADLERLRNAALEAGLNTQFSPTEAVDGLQSLTSAGQTATQAMQSLLPVLDLTAGALGELTVAQSAEAVVGTLSAFNWGAGRATEVTDKLLRTTQLTNFTARDFEAGLAKAASTGATFNQQLDDVLITMGLLRNRNIDASSAATAYREAVRRIGAETHAQNAILSMGVDIFDRKTNKMRSVVDIILDFEHATKKLTDAERNRSVVEAFGALGLLAFNATTQAAFTTMRDGREVTLEGRDAIGALREELTRAGGTAQTFRDTLLNTFAGQKTLLGGTMQTWAIALGEPFAKVLKPIVESVVSRLNSLLQSFLALPMSAKKGFVWLTLGASSLAILTGVALITQGAIGLLNIGLGVLGITLSGFIATVMPVIGTVAAVAAAMGGLVWLLQNDIGGIATASRNVWQGFQQGLLWMWQSAKPIVASFVASFDRVKIALQSLFATWSNILPSLSPNVLQSLGSIVGVTVGGALLAVLKITELLVSALSYATVWLVKVMELGAHVAHWFVKELPEAVQSGIGAAWRWLQSLWHGLLSGLSKMQSAFSKIGQYSQRDDAPKIESHQQISPVRMPSITTPTASIVEAQARTASDARTEQTLHSYFAKVTTPPDKPIAIALQVDGETLARVVHAANQEQAARQFAPLPMY